MAVHEDWDGGAGNGLGTLYAYEKAVAKAKTFETPIDIDELMRNGSSVVLFHTAGKGTRFPMIPPPFVSGRQFFAPLSMCTLNLMQQLHQLMDNSGNIV